MAEAAFSLDGVDDAFALNAAQLGMLFHSLAEPGTGVYVGILDAIVPDDLETETFKQAWDIVVARHDALRSVVVWEGVDEPLQVVRSDCTLIWEDLGNTLPAVEGKLDRAFVETFRREGIDLGREPTMRFALGRLESGERYFLWACHHALIDDWSQAIVLQEVQELYAALRRGEAVEGEKRVGFGEFAHWQSGQDEAAGDTFWRKTFANFQGPARLQLPRAEASEDPSLRGQSDRQLGRKTSDALRSAANQARVTLAAVATGVWSVVMHRLTGEDEVTFGLAATQRPPELGDMDRAVGNFVTTMPVVSRVADHPTLAEMIEHTRDFVQDAQPHSAISLSKVQDIVGLPHDQPLIECILSIKQDALAVLDGKDGLFSDPWIQFKSNFPLAVVVMPGDDIGLRVIYDPRIYGPEAAEIVLDAFSAALSNVAQSMSAAPAALGVMPQALLAKVERGLTPDVALPEHEGIVETIRAQALKHPDKAALVSTGETVSYASLIVASETIAAGLRDLGLGVGDRVGIYLDRSANVPIAMLGCLTAGVTYVPFDAAFPEKRLDQMIVASQLSAILTTDAHIARLSGHMDRILDIKALMAEPKGYEPAKLSDSDLAYMMFTSGSTGTPKGVQITHGNLAASTGARTAWYGRAPERFLLLSSHAFDSSVVGLYWTLTAGGTLVIPNAEESKTVSTLADMIAGNQIDHMLSLPSFYHLMLDKALASLATLDTVIVAGEATTPDLIKAHQSSGLSARLVNEYGPTEATVWCAAADLTNADPDHAVPIGGPIPGTQLVLRDAQGRLVPNGLPAELCVAGAGLAKGYFGEESNDASPFFTNEDGERFYRTGDLVRLNASDDLVFLGRADGQVKIRGHRVELAEIERLLAGRPDIREAAAAVHGTGASARLVAYVQPKDAARITPDALAAACKAALPNYMIPGAFVLMEQMPRTPNGKVDRKALPAPDQTASTADLVRPTTATESVLRELWRRALWLDRDIGINENFFDLGGHSLVAIRLMSDIQESFDLKLPATTLGRMTTVEDQAKQIERARRSAEASSATAVDSGAPAPDVFHGLTPEQDAKLAALCDSWRAPPARNGFKIRVANAKGTLTPLFFCFLDEYSFTQLAEGLGPDQPIYAIRGSNQVVPMSGEDAFEENMRRTAISYLPEVLELAGDTPILLGGYCQGGTIAMHLAALLTALQRSVATVISVEKTPPVSFPGHVDIIFAEKSFLNPYGYFDQPEQVWARRYGSHRFEIVPGDYLKVYHPQYLPAFAATVRQRLQDARNRALTSLPRAAQSIEWTPPAEITSMAPKDVTPLTIGLRNTGALGWTPESGLRVKSVWRNAGNAIVEGTTAYTALEQRVEKGATASLTIDLRTPEIPGHYTVEIDMIEEGVASFSKMGSDLLHIAVVVDANAAIVSHDSANATDTTLARAAEQLNEGLANAARMGPTWLGQHGNAQQSNAVAQNLSASLRNLGTLHLRCGNLENAANALTSALDLNPEDGPALLSLARVHLAKRRYISAHRLLARAQATDPETAREATALMAATLSIKAFARAVKAQMSGQPSKPAPQNKGVPK